jgi:signal transduction histidine kinase
VNLQSLSALLAAIVTAAIATSVVLRDRRQPSSVRFAVLCFTLCAWHVARFLDATLDWEPVWVMSLFAAVAIPILSVRFFRSLFQEGFMQGKAGEPPAARGAPRQTPRWMVVVTALFMLFIAYSLVFPRARLLHKLPFAVTMAAYVFGGLYASMVIVYRKYRRTLAPVEKTRLLYLLVGGVASVTLAATDFLPLVGVPFPSLGSVLTIIYMYFISQTLFRYRLLDLNEVLGRMVVLSTLVLILAAIYALLVAWVPATQVGVFFFNTLVASFVILILFEPLRTVIEGQVQRWMFREKYELKARVDALRGMLANVIDIREAARVTIASLEASQRVTQAAVYLVDADAAGYDLGGHLGPKPVERVDAAARRPFFERLSSTRMPIAVEQLERELAARTAWSDRPGVGEEETETIDAIARALDEMNGALAIPILAEDQVLGVIALKDERLREAYATDEVDLFRGVAAQMAITIQNSKLYDRMKERDRLAALGEMAAGLAHEIRNPLGAIKGAAQLLLPPTPSEEAPPATPAQEAHQFLSIIVEEANRLNKVVSQFLDYARPYRGEPAPLDVNEVVRKSAQLVTPPPLGEGGTPPVDVVLALAEDLPRVRGDAEQLRQVFLNLAINAVQAMAQGGKLTISTSLRKGGRRGAPAQFLEVRFRDNGPGIPPGEIKNLFIPFYTTKEKGTGLGLPISQRIIENHGGTIEVRSRLGVGSTFTVVLPAAEVEAEAKAS